MKRMISVFMAVIVTILCFSVSVFAAESAESSLSKIPTVRIQTSLGLRALQNDKNTRDKSTTVVITDGDGNTVYSDIDLGVLSEMKGRGNGTWSEAKKPFQIKLGKKTDLFGMGKAKTWVLLANYVDSSFIRNAVAYQMATDMGIPFTPKSVFVDLYVDNQYQGLYQLIEKTQIGDNRIEIDDLEERTEKENKSIKLESLPVRTVSGDDLTAKTGLQFYTYVEGVANPDDITGGYLIEMDNLYADSETSRFRTANGNDYVIKSPEYASYEQVRYIAGLVAEMEEAIYSDTGYNSLGKHYSEYCDAESMIQVYVVEEMTKNWDAYVGSMFFYKDADRDGVQSKIYGGPVWDFDNTYGNIRYEERAIYGQSQTELYANGKNNWYQDDFGKQVIKHKELAALLSVYTKKAEKSVLEMVSPGGFIDDLTAQIYDSVLADIKLWGTQRISVFRTFNTYLGETANTAIGYLKDYMKVRAKAIAKYYAIDGRPTWTIDGHTLVIDGNGCADENLADQTLWQEKSDEIYEISVGSGINAVDVDLFGNLDHLTVINVTGKDTRILGGDSLCRDVILCGKTASEVQRFASQNGYSFASVVNCAHLLRSHITPTDPTEKGPGNSEYWACDSCGKYFSDGRCTHEIPKDSWIIPALPTGSGTETSISTEPGTIDDPSEPAVTQKTIIYGAAIGGGIIIVLLIVLGMVLTKKKKAR